MRVANRPTLKPIAATILTIGVTADAMAETRTASNKADLNNLWVSFGSDAASTAQG
jgi:hypothetical protein